MSAPPAHRVHLPDPWVTHVHTNVAPPPSQGLCLHLKLGLLVGEGASCGPLLPRVLPIMSVGAQVHSAAEGVREGLSSITDKASHAVDEVSAQPYINIPVKRGLQLNV